MKLIVTYEGTDGVEVLTVEDVEEKKVNISPAGISYVPEDRSLEGHRLERFIPFARIYDTLLITPED